MAEGTVTGPRAAAVRRRVTPPGFFARVVATAAVAVAALASTSAHAAGGPLVYVKSVPPGAEVFLDKDAAARGKTPCFVSDAAPGRHTVRLTLDGYKDASEEVVVPERGVATVEVKLVERAAGPPPAPESTLQEKLARKVSFKFADIPITEAVRFLSRETGIDMTIDPAALGAVGVVPISLGVNETPARMALARVLRLANLDYAIKGEGLFISTPERLGDSAEIRRADRNPSDEERAAKDAGDKEVGGLLSRKVSPDFVETPLAEAVLFLETLTKASFILDPDVAGKVDYTAPVTLKVKDMPLDQVLERMLDGTGLAYVVRDGAVFVSTPEGVRGGAARPKDRSDQPDQADQADQEGKKEAEAKKEEIPRTIEVDCPYCKGSGLIMDMGCSYCSATGYVGVNRCGRCNGTAREACVCPTCKGQGVVLKGTRGVECPTCRGRKHQSCPACKGKGKISRPNPDAYGRPTMACPACNGSGFEQNVRCKRCGSTGNIKVRNVTGGTVLRAYYTYMEVQCPFCGGNGTGLPVCEACEGRGHRDAREKASPCMACAGTGHTYRPCSVCGGKGRVPDRGTR